MADNITILDSTSGTRTVRTLDLGSNIQAQMMVGVDLSLYRNLDLKQTGQVVKNAAGRIYNWEIFNNSTAFLYVKVYDKATAATSSDTPKLTWEIAPGQFVGEVMHGKYFSAGISVRCTAALADNDVTDPATNDCVINLGYL